MPEGAHPLPDLPHWEEELLREQWEEQTKGGWKGAELVENDGENWPLDFAAKLLQMPEKDLRDLVRIVNNLHEGALEPTGTIRMASFRRQGRHPRAYPGSKLVRLAEGLAELCESLSSA